VNPQELRQLMAAKAEEARAIYETAQTEKRDVSDEEKGKYSLLIAEAKRLQAEAERVEELEKFVKPMQSGSQRAGNGQFVNGRGSGEGYTKTADTAEALYCRHLRTGDSGVAAELRAYNNTDMNVTTEADGEVIVPVGMVNDIKARRDEMALFPKLGVTRVPGKGTTVNYPIDNEADVLFLTEVESADIDQDAPALTEKAFTLAKYAKYMTLTWELLRDEDANLMAFINNWVARGWAATHNSALLTEVYANGTAGATGTAVATVAAADVPTLVGKVAPEYQDGSQWIMHPTTKAQIESLASSSIFTFAPTPGGNPSGPTLWGYPVNSSSYATAHGSGNKSLVFGNFNFLGMREGTGLTTLRDPYSSALKGQVRLHFWFDLVYGVLQAEAINYLTHPTAV